VISQIEAHNYRCFPKLAIDLDRYHVFAGPNGAGKSILLDVPVLIGDMLRRQALDRLRRRHKIRLFNANFGRLALAMSVKTCRDPTFNQLREQLRIWFSEH
jgi:predicted ATP-binding protein involved in virulence